MRITKSRGMKEYVFVLCKFIFSIMDYGELDFCCYDTRTSKNTTTKKLPENKRFFARFEKYIKE